MLFSGFSSPLITLGSDVCTCVPLLLSCLVSHHLSDDIDGFV